MGEQGVAAKLLKRGTGTRVGIGKWKHGQVGVTKHGICTRLFQKRGQPAACGPMRVFAFGENGECEIRRCCVIPCKSANNSISVDGCVSALLE